MAFWLIFPMVLWLVMVKISKPSRPYYYSIAIIWKVFASFVTTWFSINQWGFGDLPTYFVLAKSISRDCLPFFESRWCSDQLLGGYVPAWLNAGLFLIFPASIYGLSVFSGVMSFLYAFTLVSTIEKHFFVSGAQRVLVYFLPVFSMQSGYIGKETYILPLISIALLNFAKPRIDSAALLSIAFCVVAIGVIRPYQALFVGIPIMFAFLCGSKFRFGTRLIVFSLTASAVLWSVVFGIQEMFWWIEGSIFDGGIDLVDALAVAYDGGSLMLSPYIFPFHVLQNFRPFPWEAHNLPAFLSSLEFLFVLLFSLYGILNFSRGKYSTLGLTDAQNRIRIFLASSAVFYLFIFGFSSNVNDLSRRHVYYYPLILLIFCKPRS